MRVKTAKKRSLSSTLWLQRQLNDPYVVEAQKRGYRSRAAFKLLQLDDKFKLLSPGKRVVDLGAAPGGWTQVAVERVKPQAGKGKVVGLDILEMEPVEGAITFQCDFNDDNAPDRLREALDGPADIVLSDMAAPATGHPQTDHIRIMGLAELAYDFAAQVLSPGKRVVDLGAAPGGWTQVAVERVKPQAGKGKVVGLDILEMEPVEGAITFQCDFNDDNAPDRLREALDGPADIVLSDMAAPATGHPQTDHIRIMGLGELAYDFAAQVLSPGGAFIAKVFQGGTERQLLDRLKRDFSSVKHAKPPASRADSAETYVVAVGFRGGSAVVGRNAEDGDGEE